jgi:hypothetical protein
MDATYCAEKAEECELRAAEQPTAALRREWLRMASEWRLTPAPADLQEDAEDAP